MSTPECRKDDPELVVEHRFAVVPEWLLDAPVSDCAVRLFAILLRYGQSSGARMPGRATLARRLRKKSTDTVDRALKELVELGAVAVEPRYAGKQRLTNRYHLRSTPPRCSDAPTAGPETGRTNAATRSGAGGGGRKHPAGGHPMDAEGVAAPTRHDPEFLTQSTTSSPSTPQPAADGPWAVELDRLAAECGITDWPDYVIKIRRHRIDVGAAVGRWDARCLHAALHLAVRGRGWPAGQAAAALEHVAADPATRSPMRLAEAGPWWDGAGTTRSNPTDAGELDRLEQRLTEAGGLRVALQLQARSELAAEGRPVTRATVIRRAAELLDIDRQAAST